MSAKKSKKARNTRGRLPLWAVIGSIVLLVIIALAVYFGPRYFHPKPQAATLIPTRTPLVEYTPDQAFALFGVKTVTFVDIRSSSDFKAYHIADSISIPADELSSHLADIPRTGGTVILVDDYGGEPAINARATLLENGFKSVAYITGGLDAWVQKHYPVIGTARY